MKEDITISTKEELDKFFEEIEKDSKKWRYKLIRFWFWLISIPYNLKYWWAHRRYIMFMIVMY